MEGQRGERWVRVGAFSCCSARSCTSTRKVDNPHLSSSLLFYSILFWASFSRLLSLVFPPPILSFNCLHPACRGGCAREEPGDERWWLADTEQTAAAARRASGRTLPSSWHCCRWAGVCQHLFGSLWCPVPNWGRGEPASFPCSCGCSLLQRGRAEELEAMTFQALQMFAQWMWVSLSFPSSLLSQWLFSNLSILSFLQMRSKSGALCSSCQVSLRWNKKEIVASPASQCDTVTYKTYSCFLSFKWIVRTQSFRLHVLLFISMVSYWLYCSSLKQLSKVRAKKDISHLRLCRNKNSLCETQVQGSDDL